MKLVRTISLAVAVFVPCAWTTLVHANDDMKDSGDMKKDDMKKGKKKSDKGDMDKKGDMGKKGDMDKK